METPCNLVGNLPTQAEVEDTAAAAPPTPPVFVVDLHSTSTNVYVPLRCRQGGIDYSTLALTHFLESPHFNTLTSVSTSPGGEYIAIGDDHGHVEERNLPHLQY